MKTCTVCGVPKGEDDFYYDSATDTLIAKCRPCASRYNTLRAKYKKAGKKLTTKEFREKKLYKKELAK